jgi:bile acid-coenzyme A ligase
VGRGFGAEVRVLDDRGEDVPAHTVGEIYLRRIGANGPSYEYRGAPPAKTTEDGFVSVGDLGWLDEDGFLYIADRRTDMIVSGGANVYPAEVEAALSEHPAVADVVVIGLSDEEWGHRVHAVIQREPLAPSPSIDDLAAHCRERLSHYKVPKSFEFVAVLPRTDAGKLNRSAIAAEREEVAARGQPSKGRRERTKSG